MLIYSQKFCCSTVVVSEAASCKECHAYKTTCHFQVPKYNYPPPVSSGEIASAIQAAKEASAAVMAAQQRVQEAKDDVLHQQHVAREKENQAALALQKAEAQAAIQRQEAKAAATAVVRSQQRLAQAKAEVSEAQRIASAKEAHAAAILQKSAHAAAAEIQKSGECFYIVFNRRRYFLTSALLENGIILL